MSADIQILPSGQIDHAKWDTCIRLSGNPLIYATAGYLNHLTDSWSGMIMNDYECVMPVPWRKKLGIRYTYDVPFMPQLGWFCLHSPRDTMPFVKALFDFCRYGDYHFNAQNSPRINNAVLSNNFILELFQPYQLLKEKYNNDLVNNLKKANKLGLEYSGGEFNSAIDLYRDLYRQKTPHVSTQDYENFRRVCALLTEKNHVIVRNVHDPGGELLATALLLKDDSRLYNMMNSTTPTGRKTEANHFLFDNILREFAESDLIFDFEGSDIPGVKSFYEKFGGKNQPYYKLHINRLPFPLRLLKR